MVDYDFDGGVVSDFKLCYLVENSNFFTKKPDRSRKRSKCKIIEHDRLFGDVIETIGSGFFNSTDTITWVKFHKKTRPEN